MKSRKRLKNYPKIGMIVLSLQKVGKLRKFAKHPQVEIFTLFHLSQN